MGYNDIIVGNGDTKFTKEVRVGDWVSVSSVPNVFVPVTQIIDDNNLGIGFSIIGADYSLQTIKIRRPAVISKDEKGNPVFAVVADPNGLSNTTFIGQDILNQFVNGPYVWSGTIPPYYAPPYGVNIMDPNGIQTWNPTTVNSNLTVSGNVTASGTVTANALTASSLTVAGTALPTFPINLGGSGVTGVLPYTSAGLKGFVQSSDFSPYVNIPIYELSSGTSSQVLGVSPGSNAWALKSMAQSAATMSATEGRWATPRHAAQPETKAIMARLRPDLANSTHCALERRR